MADHDNEVFIDADAGFSNDKDSYEVLILKQMSKCADILSKEMVSGHIVYRTGVGGIEKYTEDINELVINHVDTFKMLLSRMYIKGDNKKQLDIILKEISEKEQEIKDRQINIPGRGLVKLKDIKGLSVDNLHWKEFVTFKARKYREIFEILVNCYNECKAEIRDLEQE